jgi:GNAT superfamily N-acetyltransferase
MSIVVERASLDRFGDIPVPCGHCLYWQTKGEYAAVRDKDEYERRKRLWFENVGNEFGNPIRAAYLDGVPVGFLQFAPARFFPRIAEYTTATPSNKAIFIACLYVVNEKARGKGVGTAMLNDLVRELWGSRCRVVETFARRGSANNPSGPLEFYLKHGFKTVDGGEEFPLVRLES